MRLHKRLRALLLAGVMTCTAMAISIPSTDIFTVQADDTNNDDWLHAVGSRLYDKDGNEVWLTGANWFGFNCSENFPHGLWSADLDDMLSSIADHGINVIRFPVSTELLLSWMNGDPLTPVGLNASNSSDYSFNPDLCDENGNTMDSFGIFNVILKKMKQYGIKAFVDVHSPATHNSGHNYNLWYYDASAADAGNMAVGYYSKEEITYDDWITSLTWLAEQYKDDDTLIGYDLKNEPHGKGQDGSTAAKWDGSDDANNWAAAATDCANSILAVNPNALIFVEGVEQSLKSDAYTWGQPDSKTDPPYIPAWWGGNLRGVREYPIEPDSGTSQIVYSPHDYGPSVYDQTWFQKDFTEQTLLDDYWYDTWAYINAENIAPLLIGEWGGHMDGAENEKWMKLLRDYMINHHISHTFWCINPNSGDTGGLLGYDFVTWDEDKYNLLEPALWQTQETGKYIGLDHQTPLGTNDTGISLSEFYASYASTEGSNLDGGTIIGSDTTKPTTLTTASTTTTTTTITTMMTTTLEDKKLCGDINGDAVVTVSDLILLNRFLLNRSIPEGTYNWDLADVDGNGKLNVFDAVYYKWYLLGTDRHFPAES